MNHHVSEDTSNTDAPRRCPDYNEDLPIRINVLISDGDDFTETSSVTTAHFDRAELFGPSMYPSTQSVSDVEDVSVPDIDAEAPVEGTDGMGHRGTSVEDMGGTESTINLDDHQLKLEVDKLHNGSAPKEEIGQTQATENSPEVQERGSWISNFLSPPMLQRPVEEACKTPQDPLDPSATGIENDSIKGENDPHTEASPSIQDIVDLAMPLPGSWISSFLSRQRPVEGSEDPLDSCAPAVEGNSLHTSDPGAYRVSASGSITSRERDGLEMVDLQPAPQELPLEDSGLVQAWPVSADLVIATPIQDPPEDHSSQTLIAGIISWKVFFLGLLVMLATILASSLTATLLFTNDPNKAKYTEIKGKVMDAFGETYFDNPQKEKALHWIVYEDPRNSLGVEEKGQPTNLLQRFSLVSFYFQTCSQQPWATCNPPLGTQPDTCYSKGFYSNTGRPTEEIATRWLTAAHECQWMGVICAGSPKQVTELQIVENNITGTIPADEIAMLTQLKVLNFERNNLTGSLPSGLFQSSSLAQIFLDQNKLTGSIPVQAFMLPKITMFSLSTNLLKGRIPTQIGLFHGKHLRLIGNVLTGSLPEELCAATSVESLYLSDNLLTGTLSSCIGALTELNVLEVQSNPLEGSIPSQIGLLHRLHTLLLKESNICGTLPEELYQNQALQYFQVGGSNLSGTISTRIGHMKKLIAFEVSNNNFHGTIPAELSGATNLCILSVHGNRNLTGSIAETFCSQLHQGCKVHADCKPRESNGVPTVVCPEGCCSTCCDAETEVCTAQ